MDHPLLKSIAAAALAFLFFGCLFNDPSDELNPALQDSTLVSLSSSDHFPVLRKHILESFGSFGCVSCPGAESHLLPYIHAKLNSPGYDSNLIIANYHVKFGTISDPWVTTATQARYDQSFSNSLPQVTLDGSNAPFGIRETDVEYDQGEYDSLVYRLQGRSNSTYLDLSLDTAALVYDSAAQKLRVRFTVLNRDTVSQGALSFRVLAVKNLSVKFPVYPKPWEVIVAETSDRDSSGQSMTMPSLPALKAKTFSVALGLSSESLKSPPPPNPENPAGYAVVVIAKNGQGIVQNVFSLKYAPQ